MRGAHSDQNCEGRALTRTTLTAWPNRNFPDHEEDKIACFIKTLTEKRIGPTWHVLVGR